MWFKNARFYTVDLSELNQVFSNPQELENALEKAKFKPCQAQEISTIGFAPLFGGESAYHFSSGSNFFFKMVEETKLLPSSVVKNELDAQCDAYELEIKRQLRKNEKDALKTAITGKLLTQAFATRRELLIFINKDEKLLSVAATSAKRAEKAIALFREAFSTFPAKLLSPRCVVEDRMTTWLKENRLPEKFEFGTDTILKSTDEDGGIIRASREDLTSEEISVHLNAGKVVTEIGLAYNDALNFALSSDISVKRLKPTDIYLEKNLNANPEDEIEDLQSQLVLQGELLTELEIYLLEIFDCDR